MKMAHRIATAPRKHLKVIVIEVLEMPAMSIKSNIVTRHVFLRRSKIKMTRCLDDPWSSIHHTTKASSSIVQLNLLVGSVYSLLQHGQWIPPTRSLCITSSAPSSCCDCWSSRSDSMSLFIKLKE
jgi:hypothetical protein